MSTSIAFLSGKGGSGKTTLALSMANLLCKCGIKTLLIDCDMSTNGATYFYESQLVDRSHGEQTKLLSFSAILSGEDFSLAPSIFEISPNLAFIPSVSEFSDHHLSVTVENNNRNVERTIHNFLYWVQSRYDVILFDCQAGYTDILPVLLPLMDVDLFVLEADSISASSMRSLHLKIGKSLGRARLYQVFNKATQEEFEIYSKIVGTFFTNIGTLLFDWKIRQAFSRAQVPDLEYTSAKFGADLCDICKIIFPDKPIKRKLDSFSDSLSYRELKEKHKAIEDNLYKFARKSSFSKFLPLSLSVVSLYVAVMSVALPNWFDIYIPGIENMMTVVMALTSVILVYSVWVESDSFQEKRKTRQKYERELREIDRELEKMASKLSRNSSDNEDGILQTKSPKNNRMTP